MLTMGTVYSCSEFKKRQKAQRVAAEKAEKAVCCTSYYATVCQAAFRAVRDTVPCWPFGGRPCHPSFLPLPGHAPPPLPPSPHATYLLQPYRNVPLSVAPQAKKAEEAAAAPKKAAGGLLDDSTEELDPNLYFENRVRVLNAKRAAGNPYPHKFHVTTAVPAFAQKYKSIAVRLAALLYGKALSNLLACGVTSRQPSAHRKAEALASIRAP